MKKILKKFFITLLVVLFLFDCISFAVVSDNDGSSFITKSEFDSLKNKFQSQIDAYNTGIDSKIDNAISSYLSGVVEKKEYNRKCNIDLFTWPIKIINKNNDIENLATSSTNQYNVQPIWAPGYDILAVYQREFYLVTQKFSRPAIDSITNYFNGTPQVSSGTFVINHICVNPKTILNTTYIHENLLPPRNTTNVSTLYDTIVFDANANENPNDMGNLNTYNRKNVMGDYEINKISNTYKPAVGTGYHHPYNKINFAGGAGAQYYDKISMNGGANHLWAIHIIGGFDALTMMTNTYTYSTKKLDMIYNYGDSTNASHFAPTTQNDALYFTNKKCNRVAITEDRTMRMEWKNRTAPAAQLDYGTQYILTAGENLEHENEHTTQVWYKKALISADRILYNFVANKKSYSHKMVEGIPIFYFPSDTGSSEPCKNVKITFSLTSQSTLTKTNKKYAIISTKPIKTQLYNQNVEANADYIKILNNNGVVSNVKKVTLVEGENKLTVDGEFDVGVVLYLKILFDDSTENNVTLSMPEIVYSQEG